MHRIDSAGAVGVLPVAAAVGAPGYFKNQPPGAGQPSTIVTDDWLNAVQEEIMSVIVAAGLAPDKTDNAQLLAAIQSVAGAGAVVGAGAIHGMVLSNAAGNPTTRITVSAGLARDSTNTAGLTLAAALTKRLDLAWSAGDNGGGRDAGALANGQTWHVFAIKNPTTNAVDALFSQSPTAPTLPGGFTKFRRLGAVVLEAASTSIREFFQVGDWFFYKNRSTDFAVQPNGGGVPYYREFPGLPLGIEGRALGYFQSTGTANATAYLSGLFPPQFGVPPAFGGASQRATVRRVAAYQQASGVDLSYGTVDGAWALFDTARHIYTFSSDNAGDVIAAGIIAWEDLRGRFF